MGNFRNDDEPKEITFWTYEQFKEFISVVDENVYMSLYSLLYFSGMRLGESLALTWNDLKYNTISINKTISKGKLNGKHIIDSPKTKKSNRAIILDNETTNILLKLKEHYRNYIGFDEKWFIFGGLNPLSATTVGRKKDQYCELANVKRIKMHDFRHSHATLLLSKGVPVTVISKRLGHSDISMTLNTYSHLIPEDEDKAVNLINQLKNNDLQENNKRTENLDIKKTAKISDLINKWSERQDSNLRPLGPKPSALPSCATFR